MAIDSIIFFISFKFHDIVLYSTSIYSKNDTISRQSFIKWLVKNKISEAIKNRNSFIDFIFLCDMWMMSDNEIASRINKFSCQIPLSFI